MLFADRLLADENEIRAEANLLVVISKFSRGCLSRLDFPDFGNSLEPSMMCQRVARAH